MVVSVLNVDGEVQRAAYHLAVRSMGPGAGLLGSSQLHSCSRSGPDEGVNPLVSSGVKWRYYLDLSRVVLGRIE